MDVLDFGSLLGHLRVFGSSNMLFRPENSIRNPLCRLGISLLNQVGIDVLGGAYLGVSQSFGDADGICTREIKDRGHAVAELVCVNMGEIVFLLKAGQITAESVRSHAAAAISGEHIRAILPPVTVGKAGFQLPHPILAEQIHGFLWQFDGSHGSGFCSGFVYTTL